MSPNEIRAQLAHCIGTENWYRHPMNRNITYTDGVKLFAGLCGAYWLLDILVTEPDILRQQRLGFAAILVSVQDCKALITVTDGNENTVWSRPIAFTDLPEGDWEFYFYNDTILLPSEY